MSSARTVTLDPAPPVLARWLLTLVHHPDPARLGGQIAVPLGDSLTLGRDGSVGQWLLDDVSVSRRHARFEADDAALRVIDLASSNGTWRGDSRVAETTLRSGDAVRLGAVVLLARRVERVPGALGDGGFPAFSEPMARVAAALGEAPERLRAVVLRGPPYAGIDAVASALAARTPAGLPVLSLPLSAPDETTHEALFERAAGRTVLLGPLPLADRAWQDSLVALSSRALPPRLMLLWWPDAGSDDEVARDVLARALDARTISLPPLRERGEDLPHLVRDLALRAHGRAPRLHHTLLEAMLRAPWPDDLRGLAALVSRHLAPPVNDEPIALSPALESALGAPDASPSAPVEASAPASRGTVIARDAGWFQARGEPVVSLAGRFALARVLRALVDARVERPGRGVSVEDLVSAAWSGQRTVSDSGAHRAYVAVSTLRRIGLAEALCRNEDGYLLDPATTTVADAPTR